MLCCLWHSKIFIITVVSILPLLLLLSQYKRLQCKIRTKKKLVFETNIYIKTNTYTLKLTIIVSYMNNDIILLKELNNFEFQ